MWCGGGAGGGGSAERPGGRAGRWCPICAESNGGGVRKGRGMASFAGDGGFELCETMAFGDGGNDAAMLRAAGVGVAMGNACEAALRAADHVTAAVEDDGVRRALEHFGIIGR